MGLDARGIIAVIEIIIYIPVLVIGAVLSYRHGFKREAGWIFLVILSLIRIIGGVAHVLSENNPTNSTERVIYTIMETAGLSPLLVASLGFLRTVMQYSLDQTSLISKGLRILGLVGTIGLILAISGGSGASDASSQDDLDSATNQRHAGAILFLVLYIGVVALTFYCWHNRRLILRYRQQLLTGVTATLPFLLIRVIYSMLSSFAPYPVTFQDGQQVSTQPSNSGLGQFSFASSQWGIYLGMSVLMEYVAVLIYAVVGIVTPLDKDVELQGRTQWQHNKDDHLSNDGYSMEPVHAR